ncbi:hypothetical protein B0H63DRAFT_459646 [Podospora didyma]|uniref:Uncharacterized protein n=1 Tax=Podospora didyma TaxID=330526 RepID=A0AAE0U7T4_9PEZI|nr:hypothetical protein B0H63DRAFT_459646 [Podospora didyma]
MSGTWRSGPTEKNSSGESSRDEGSRQQQQSSKRASAIQRKATSALSICVQCESPSQPEEDGARELGYECSYHSGIMKPDLILNGEWWKVEDPNALELDTMRISDAERFICSCCDFVGLTAGCRIGPHQAHPDKSKRGRC